MGMSPQIRAVKASSDDAAEADLTTRAIPASLLRGVDDHFLNDDDGGRLTLLMCVKRSSSQRL